MYIKAVLCLIYIMVINAKMSLYIPRVANNCFKHTTYQHSFIDMTGVTRHVFNRLNIALVGHTQVVPSKSKEPSGYSDLYVYFNEWYNTSMAIQFQDELLQNKKRGIYLNVGALIYSEPYYWNIFPGVPDPGVAGIWERPPDPVQNNIIDSNLNYIS